MAVRLVGIDIDGTLLDGRGEVPRRNCGAMRAASDLGVRIVVITGRSYAFAAPVAARLGVPLVLVASNGALVKTLDGLTLSSSPLLVEVARSVVEATGIYHRMYAEKVTTAMRQNFVDSNRVLAGSLERLAQGANYRDGATVEAFTWSLIPADDTIATATLGAMSYLQTPAGGYKRVEGSQDQYDTDEWILIDLRASAAFRRVGNTPKADQLLGWVTAQASANYDLLPELYNTRSSSGQIGAYSGSIPMVGYGAGAYQLTMLDRVQLYEHADCREKDLGEYPDAGPVLQRRSREKVGRRCEGGLLHHRLQGASEAT